MHHQEDCPFCTLATGLENPNQITSQKEVIFQNQNVTAFIACDWWPNNKGHCIIIPNFHFKNLYEMPENYLGKIYQSAKIVSAAMKKAYKCEGISTRQHNEKAGNQSVFHYHVHVFPRYFDDNLYLNHKNWFRAKMEERISYAKNLKKFI